MADTYKSSSPSNHSIDDAGNALETFERILELMPDDRSALEAVIVASETYGDHEKAITYRLQLAKVLLASSDKTSTQEFIAMLREESDPRILEWLRAFDAGEVTAAQAKAAAPVEPRVTKTAATSKRATFNISDEIDLAWHLYEHQEISQEEYSGLVQDITEMSTSSAGGTVSLLHALEAANHKNLEKILSFLSQSSRSPYVSLSNFTMRAELIPFLSPDFIHNRGAIPFEVMGNELLIALLNPISKALRVDIQEETEHPCHIYLTRAADFDKAMKSLSESNRS